jgi:hypothetical protein
MLTLILELGVASVAAILSILSIRTLQAIKHLGLGKSFWIPIAVTGILFSFGSILNILQETIPSYFQLITQTSGIAQALQILALITLLAGIYSYSRKVTKTLAERPKPTIQEEERDQTAEEDSHETKKAKKTKIPVTPAAPAAPAAPEAWTLPPIQERIAQEQRLRPTTVHVCQHELGYLKTLPKNTPIPDECLTCNRIVECKHASPSKLEKPEASPTST